MFLRPLLLLASGTLGAAALVGVPTSVASAAPTTWLYPSVDCPLNATQGLQDCVDHASPGDTIELAQEIIDEDVIVNKSLTLEPDSPSLRPELSFVSVRDQDIDGLRDLRVNINHVRVVFGLTGILRYGSIDHVTLEHVVVGKDTPSSQGITFDGEAPVDLDVESSYARTTDHQQPSLQLYTQYSTGLPSRLRAVGNKVTQHLAPNHDSGSGIDAEASLGSQLDVQIYNNQIWDVVGDAAGAEAGITLYPGGTSSMTADIVGNTLDTVGSAGLYLRDDVVAPGHVTVNAFNNVFSHMKDEGLFLDSSTTATLTFHGGYNDFFKNGRPNIYDGKAHGPGNRTVNPRYVDRADGDLRLRPSSPLIDRGQACTAGGVANLDAAGHGRVVGRNVDLGAYELGAHSPTGKVRLGTKYHNLLRGTKGRDILCGFKGDDTLIGRRGGDFLDGGAGRDKLDGGSAADWLYGGSGRDTACTPLAGDHRFSVEHTKPC
jgi:Ca2+-binding RTX toxin-like protein